MRTVAAFALTLLAPFAAAPLAAQAPAPAETATAKFSLDTPIVVLEADPQARAVVEGAIPQLSAHPMYERFKNATLPQIAPMSQGRITDAQLKQIAAGLAAIK